MSGWAGLLSGHAGGWIPLLHSHPRAPPALLGSSEGVHLFQTRTQPRRFVSGVRLWALSPEEPCGERVGMTQRETSELKGHWEVELARLDDWVTSLRWVHWEERNLKGLVEVRVPRKGTRLDAR